MSLKTAARIVLALAVTLALVAIGIAIGQEAFAQGVMTCA